MSDKPSYTPKQAAEELGVSDETIYRWIRTGLMTAKRRGLNNTKPRYFIDAAEVERVRTEGNYGEEKGNNYGLVASA